MVLPLVVGPSSLTSWPTLEDTPWLAIRVQIRASLTPARFTTSVTSLTGTFVASARALNERWVTRQDRPLPTFNVMFTLRVLH